MKKYFSLLFLVIFISLSAFKGDKPAYLIYTAKGKTADYGDLLKAAKSSDLIFFGELHDNPICHWLEYELTRDLYEEKQSNLSLGAEMFERDNQLLLTEYVTKMIRKKDFEAEAKLWPNYKTDYAPLVDFAREKGLRFVATNVPRRYAALVNLKGFEGLDSLNAGERGLIASLRIKYDTTLECYKSIAKAVGDGMPAHMTQNLGKAQALKDATMAQFIMKGGPGTGQCFLHINGAYHSDNYEGIVWYAKDYIRKNTIPVKILTISCVEQDTIADLKKENISKADFIICIPASMTKTR